MPLVLPPRRAPRAAAARPAVPAVRRALPLVGVLVALPAAAFVGRPLAAQSVAGGRLPAAATIPLGDPVYPVLDELLALVVVPGTVVGQRPYSPREVRRLVRAADAALRARAARQAAPDPAAPAPPDAAESRAAALVDLLRGAYDAGGADDGEGERDARARLAVRARPIDAITVDAAASRASVLRLPLDNGLGSIDASVLPSLDPRGGRPVVRGLVTSVETLHTLGVGDWLALVAQPRVSLLTPSGGDARQNVALQRAYLRVRLANVAVQAGVDERTLGQAGDRGPFLSRNAPPLHAVSVASDTAFRLPWVLGGLGQWQAQLLLADLGRGQRFPNSRLAVWHLSLSPIPRLELGAGVMSQYGGTGAPGKSAAEVARDLFPFVFWAVAPGSDRRESNKLSTGQVRLRLPELRGTTVFWEVDFDDFDVRRVRPVLREDAGHVVGLSVARLADDGSLSLDLRGHSTGLRQYRHPQFLSGVTFRDRVLGDPLGPNARALHGTLTWRPRLLGAIAVEGAVEERDPSRYINANPDPDGKLIFQKVEQGAVERRQRGALVLRHGALGAGTAVLVRGGVELVRNHRFVPRPRREYGFAEATLQLRF